MCSAAAALSITVITHPSLITRIVLLAVFTVVGTVLCLLPFPRVGHIAIRVACASAGSFGVVLCIGIMKRDASWGNVWERMWVHDGSDWGTSQEKALSAAYCLLLCAGLACDTFLHHKFGENPDEVSTVRLHGMCLFTDLCLEMGPLFGQVHRQPAKRQRSRRYLHSLHVFVRSNPRP